LEVRLIASEAAAEGMRKPAGHSSGVLLVPMVRDAIREVDLKRGRIEVNMSFLEDV
jgi:ribosomal 30S subunit maturation factor RimM